MTTIKDLRDLCKDAMSNPILEHWLKPRNTPERPMPKIRRKVPFEQKVLTERGECWGYVIINGKPKYYFLFAFFEESSPIPKFKYPLSPATIKSIKRHERRTQTHNRKLLLQLPPLHPNK